MKIFWAWQSDLPGPISRHFVRDALSAAIEKLKQAPDIEEPSEEARRNEMHLDSDRQGLSGSPDLARAILEKIDASSVFVADVTPVGAGRPAQRDDGAAPEPRPLMNPNVAIELGYAIARLGDARLLMILNTAFGNRAGLPFDVRHKGGPIMYELAEGASKPEIAAEKARLVPRLVEALRPFIATEAAGATAPTFKEHEPRIGKAFFFRDGEVLGRNRNDNTEWVMPFRSVFYLRVIPTRPLVRPLPLDLLQDAGRFGAFGGDAVLVRENEYGVAVINPAGNTSNIDSLTQYFRSGEIWGINADVLRQGERSEEQWLLSYGVEHYTAESLNLYLQFLQSVAHIEPPYTVEAGLHGVKGRKLVHNGLPIRNDKMFEDTLTFRRILHSTDLATQDKFLLEYYELMHGQSGHARPDKLYGFPPDRK